MRRVYKFFYLPADDKRLLIRSIILLWAIRLGQWLLPFLTLRRMVAHLIHAPNRKDIIGSSSQERISWAIEATSRYVFKATCLTKALTLLILLHKKGYDASLHVGIARDEKGHFQAHAWVESEGKVLMGGGSESGQYTRILTTERTPL